MTRNLVHAVIAASIAAAPIFPAAAQTYRPSRAPDGRADLSGIYQALNTANWDLEDHSPAPVTMCGEVRLLLFESLRFAGDGSAFHHAFAGWFGADRAGSREAVLVRWKAALAAGLVSSPRISTRISQRS